MAKNNRWHLDHDDLTELCTLIINNRGHLGIKLVLGSRYTSGSLPGGEVCLSTSTNSQYECRGLIFNVSVMTLSGSVYPGNIITNNDLVCYARGDGSDGPWVSVLDEIFSELKEIDQKERLKEAHRRLDQERQDEKDYVARQVVWSNKYATKSKSK